MQIIYYVEGKTEQHLLDCLGVFGKIKIWNLWDMPIDKQIRTFKPNTHVYVVCDTDVKTNLTRFHDNIIKLKKCKVLKGILQQKYNMEDELVFACHAINNKQQLFKSFKASSDSEFKSEFIATKDPIKKLETLQFQANKLWSQALIDELKIHTIHQVFFDELKLIDKLK